MEIDYNMIVQSKRSSAKTKSSHATPIHPVLLLDVPQHKPVSGSEMRMTALLMSPVAGLHQMRD